MNIIILHGNHTQNLYKRLKTFLTVAKKRGIDVARFTKHSKELLGEFILSDSLFGNERLIIVDGIKSLKTKDFDWIANESVKYKGNLVLYEEKIFTITQLKKIPDPKKIEVFELPTLVFKFLDSFYTGNSNACINLLHKVIEKEPVEFIFSLLCGRLKELYWVSTDPSNIPYPSWRVQKLESQANKFKNGKVKDLISKLSKIDIDVKTSKAELIPSLDLLVLKELE